MAYSLSCGSSLEEDNGRLILALKLFMFSQSSGLFTELIQAAASQINVLLNAEIQYFLPTNAKKST